MCQLAHFKSGFPSEFFWHATAEKKNTEAGLTEVDFVILKEGVNCTCTNRNENSSGGFPGRIFKE